MGIFQDHFKQVFPFPISNCSSLANGTICELHPAPCIWPIHGCGWVKVGDVTPTSFNFTVIKEGYFDPPGSVITFSTFESGSSDASSCGDGGSEIYLQQHGYAPGNHGWLNILAPTLARQTWNSQAENLRQVAYRVEHPSANPSDYGQNPPTGPGSTPPSGYPG